MNIFTKTLTVVLLTLPLLASAAGKTATASMQVTFEVKESCNVQDSTSATKADATGTKATPAVACQLNTPYQVSRGDSASNTSSSAPQANAIRQENSAGVWTVTF
ncbi:hypothetical protein GJ699_27840 [Duganella sp. FT80W]|uniref:Uncharacterized protein n=1 Tax=Duganella guangzhouensis TaxID=2666084 RepID=A0A6I2L812_9BURK|nr:hypothetical protein [Duganella guangzhouensis]MRW93812.1 hypothetical protein [Duganella guangzhouensis]